MASGSPTQCSSSREVTLPSVTSSFEDPLEIFPFWPCLALKTFRLSPGDVLGEEDGDGLLVLQCFLNVGF